MYQQGYPDTAKTLAARAAIEALSAAWLQAPPNSDDRRKVGKLLDDARKVSAAAHFEAWQAAQ